MTHAAGDLARLAALWNGFFHDSELPLTLAIFRILFGLLLTVESIGLIRMGHHIYSLRRLAPSRGASSNGINLFLLFANSDSWIRVVFVAHTLACLLLLAGLFTRIAALLVFLNFASRSKQNWYVTQGGDNIAKFMSLLLIFSNAGGALSLDARFGWSWLGGLQAPASQWAQRLMQIQVSLVYLRTVQWKLRDPSWLDGTAVFHALHRNPHLRFQTLPAWIESGPAIAALTWGTLLVEGSAGTLTWVSDTRYVAILSAAVFHAGMEVFLKVKYFQYMMMVCLVLFVPSSEWMNFWTAVKGFVPHVHP